MHSSFGSFVLIFLHILLVVIFTLRFGQIGHKSTFFGKLAAFLLPLLLPYLVQVEIFGDKGRHSRSAVGTNALPLNVPVEIEAIFEVED